MRRAAIVASVMLALGILAAGLAAYGAERLRFWNLTAETITELYLAPPGSGQWGPNQCLNDPDKGVESDERLTITGVEPGRYDVKLVDKKGRACVMPNVELMAGKPYAFSISEKDVLNCKR